ncbi:hypothetical protein BH11BAC5_BH11BAC5_02110 [soil metagenome]
MGGKIWEESAEGKGSTFILTCQKLQPLECPDSYANFAQSFACDLIFFLPGFDLQLQRLSAKRSFKSSNTAASFFITDHYNHEKNKTWHPFYCMLHGVHLCTGKYNKNRFTKQ